MITGIARFFQQGAKAPSFEWGYFLHIFFLLFSLSNQWGGGGWALVPPYSSASDSGVARIC